jgi:hypothetical protein
MIEIIRVDITKLEVDPATRERFAEAGAIVNAANKTLLGGCPRRLRDNSDRQAGLSRTADRHLFKKWAIRDAISFINSTLAES